MSFYPFLSSSEKSHLIKVASRLEKGNKYLNPQLTGSKQSTVTGKTSLKVMMEYMNTGRSIKKPAQKFCPSWNCSKTLFTAGPPTLFFKLLSSRLVFLWKMYT